MPPGDKIAVTQAACKEKFDSPSCIYCGFPRCWKHGRYFRKWFYGWGAGDPEPVQRYRCQGPSCERTFSELPEEVLPYCHFHLDGLLCISEELAAGSSRYGIAKAGGWGISLRVALRAAELIGKATLWLAGYCREVTGSVTSGFRALVMKIREQVSWPAFFRGWFHALYPRRAGAVFNPHKVAIKRF
jgi:transposase-like protein